MRLSVAILIGIIKKKKNQRTKKTKRTDCSLSNNLVLTNYTGSGTRDTKMTNPQPPCLEHERSRKGDVKTIDGVSLMC